MFFKIRSCNCIACKTCAAPLHLLPAAGATSRPAWRCKCRCLPSLLALPARGLACVSKVQGPSSTVRESPSPDHLLCASLFSFQASSLLLPHSYFGIFGSAELFLHQIPITLANADVSWLPCPSKVLSESHCPRARLWRSEVHGPQQVSPLVTAAAPLVTTCEDGEQQLQPPNP